MKLRIENTYACGRSSESIVDVDEPAIAVAEWWEDVVHPLTGDGHPCGASEHALYEATVIEADDPAMVGVSESWEG